MPTYQYACMVASCGHQFDEVQAFSESALTECPQCSGRLRKVWGSIGVVFKGSGFYRNDSREGSKNGERKAESKDSAESTSGAKATSDGSSAGTSKAASGDSGTPAKSAAAKSAGDSSSNAKRKPAAAAS